MTPQGLFQIVIFFLILAGHHKTSGNLSWRASSTASARFLHPVLRWLEALIYKTERRSRGCGTALDAIRGRAAIVQRVRLPVGLRDSAGASLPTAESAEFRNPGVTPDLAFNTAVSFVTNTNWQSYSGESTLSYFVQMAALTVQNFRFGRGWNRGRHRCCAGLRAPADEDHRQFLGGHDARHRLCAAAVVAGGRTFSLLPRRDPKPASLHEG